MKFSRKLISPAQTILLLACGAIGLIANAQDQKPQPPVSQPLSGGGQSLESRFRMVRSVSGSKVVDNGGRLTIDDARSVFYVPGDKEVDVYFTWEGPAGMHHFEGVWKKPDGKVTMISDYDYTADQSRFGGYFRMLLGDTPALGLWALEARIDGESAGTHNFQIVGATRPDTPVATRRMMMIPAEIYKRAAAASVFIENLNQLGERRGTGSGFFLGPDRLVTAFQVVDGSSKVRIVTPDGRRVEASEVIAWNRREDWLILRFDAAQIAPLQTATTDTGAVGDRAYVLDVPGEGSRVLIEASIIGKQRLSNAGDRLSIGENLNRRSLGSPLLNEYGEVIGLIGGNLVPGSAFAEDLAFSARSLAGTSRGTLAVPIALVQLIGQTSATSSPTTLENLAKSGQFMSPLVGNENVLSGTLSRNLNRKTDPPQTIEERSEFSRQDTRIMVLVTWLPREKRKGIPSLQMYDLDNRLLSESPGKKKISVSPQKLSYTGWEVPLGNLPSGIYRLDVSLNSDTVWRTFFRIVD